MPSQGSSQPSQNVRHCETQHFVLRCVWPSAFSPSPFSPQALEDSRVFPRRWAFPHLVACCKQSRKSSSPGAPQPIASLRLRPGAYSPNKSLFAHLIISYLGGGNLFSSFLLCLLAEAVFGSSVFFFFNVHKI